MKKKNKTPTNPVLPTEEACCTCRTCKHWNIHIGLLKEDVGKSGLCRIVTSTSASGNVLYSSNLAATFPRNLFITGPRFGCVLWEPSNS